MKTAISLPDDLSAAIDAAARELKMSRSGLLAAAAREFLSTHRASEATDAWNRAIEKGGQPGGERGAQALRRRSKAVIRAAAGRRR